MTNIETDYLVVGAGATGMSFTDTLLDESDCDVVLVDRRHRPGGHWNDAYPFVKLHQPAAFFGVGSTELRGEHRDVAGREDLASNAEICEYYLRVLDDRFLASGRVQWFPKTDFEGQAEGGPGTYRVRSILTGEATTVKVRRKLVDARYNELTIPKLHTPNFTVDDDARFLPPNDLVDVDRPASGYTVLGAGKTSMDTCFWLLQHGVDPDAIRWVRPRDSWSMDRDSFVAGDDGLSFMRMQGGFMAAAAEADSGADMFERLEKAGVMHRLDATVDPQFFRGATLAESERVALRTIEDVVRLGHVTHVGRDEIVLEQGSIPNDADRVIVDCTACGAAPKEIEPIFQPDRIVTNIVTFGIIPWSAAVLAWAEANIESDDEKNAMCVPAPFDGELDTMFDLLAATMGATGARMGNEAFTAWEDQLRLNPANGFNASLATSTEAQQTMQEMMTNFAAAAENVTALIAARG